LFGWNLDYFEKKESKTSSGSINVSGATVEKLPDNTIKVSCPPTDYPFTFVREYWIECEGAKEFGEWWEALNKAVTLEPEELTIENLVIELKDPKSGLQVTEKNLEKSEGKTLKVFKGSDMVTWLKK